MSRPADPARPKPVPVPTPETQPYWDGAARGELRLPRCRACSRAHFYPWLECPFCGSTDLEWITASGRAGLHTSPGGRLPLNTNGGGLSYTHTGMYGMFLVQESVRQLRQEAAAQVPDVETAWPRGWAECS